jgi:hypothetical protein
VVSRRCWRAPLGRRRGAARAIETLRYEEDWRALCDPARRTEPLDPLKCIAFMPGTTLTLGGELRERLELVRNPDFRVRKDEDAVLLHRAMLHADLRVGGTARAFVQLGAFGYTGRKGEREPFDLDRLDLVQGFLDLSAPIAGGRATLRAGRQEISLGSSRLVGVRESPNVRRAFDGARAFVTARRYRSTASTCAPSSSRPASSTTPPTARRRSGGSVRTGAVAGPLKADLYYLGLRATRGRFASAQAARSGTRWACACPARRAASTGTGRRCTSSATSGAPRSAHGRSRRTPGFTFDGRAAHAQAGAEGRHRQRRS